MHYRTPEALKVEVGSVSTRQELHDLLFEAFRFPDYYGQNWDAFDECIRDVKLPPHVEITGLESLRVRLPREAELLQRCVTEFAEEKHHDITFPAA
ncbi:MAG TPA: ribonuclease inhibitor [Gallionellaceae bacterium]|nr:ribonuclease inhibitor [Gallionellaceae bacterium]